MSTTPTIPGLPCKRLTSPQSVPSCIQPCRESADTAHVVVLMATNGADGGGPVTRTLANQSNGRPHAPTYRWTTAVPIHRCREQREPRGKENNRERSRVDLDRQVGAKC